jgi:hemolysin D
VVIRTDDDCANGLVSDPKFRFAGSRTQMQVENKLVNLSPGMAVTVEIKTGSRTIISYLLSPLRKYRQDSLRER